MIDLLNSVEFIAAASGFHYGFRWHQELLERNEIAGDSRPNRSAADGLFRKTWPSQPDNWEMKPRNRDCKSANADCQAAFTIAARQTPIVTLHSRLQRGKRQLSRCTPDCSAANANCHAAATTGNRCPQSPCSAPKFVRQHIAIVMTAIARPVLSLDVSFMV
ncbi:MAG: hypothetical protein DMG16_00595 [Acidobacteria bacterium]|nr:MAG: hypothetical protein DMG16_00595 [Acidobacteriota bacterium]